MNSSDPGFLARIPSLRALVVGDFVLDRYLIGRVEQISLEAPVPVVRIEKEYRRLGGAGNIVRNLRSFGCEVHVAGVAGCDAGAEQMRRMCRELEVDDTGLLEDTSRSTTEKVRIVAQNQHVVRYDCGTTNYMSAALTEEMSVRVEAVLDTCDLVVFADYTKGALHQNLIANIAKSARARHLTVVGNPEGSDYSRYRGLSALTRNEREFWETVGKKAVAGEALVEVGRSMLRELDLEALCITRGLRGVMLELRDTVLDISTEGVEVGDVSSVGDMFVSAFGACVAAGGDYEESARWANWTTGELFHKARKCRSHHTRWSVERLGMKASFSCVRLT